MNTLHRNRNLGLVCLLVTTFGWALNWPLMKLLLQSWPPLFARGLSGVVASVILGAIATAQGQSLAIPRAVVPRLLFASFTNVFAWMGLGTIAMKFVGVGEGALLIYTVPLWTMPFAWPLLQQRPRLVDVIGLALALAGVAVLLDGSSYAASTSRTTGLVLSLLCPAIFAFDNTVNHKPFPLSPIVTAAWQVGLRCFAMLMLGIVFERPNVTAITSTGIACFVYMTLMPMAVCYLAWFETVRRISPVAASTGLLLVPMLAIIAAAVGLGEPLGVREAVAMALTLGGISLVLQRV